MSARQTLAPRCPLCQAGLLRVRRSFLDRLLNVFVPLFRYRCSTATCGWQGLSRRGRGGLRSRYLGRQVLEPSRQAEPVEQAEPLTSR